LQQVIDAGESHVVLDLAGTPIITSSGLRVAISAARRLRALPSGDLRIASASRQIVDVLELAGLLSVFKVYATSEEAVQSFRLSSQLFSQEDSS
jgi:anti-anti-sigma factor